MNGYDLTRMWYNFKFENPTLVKAKHSDMFFYLIDKWNRLGQKKQFGLPTDVTMEALGIGSYNTYKKTLADIIKFGFIKLIAESKNQYQSKIIALSKIDKATDKALDKATIKAVDESPDKSVDSIHEQLNKGTIEQRTRGGKVKSSRFKPPSKKDVYEFLIDKKLHPALAKKESEKYCDFYDSKNWYVGKNKMKNWKSAASGWINRMDNFKANQNGNSNSKSEPTVNRQSAETIHSNSQGW